ncbi:hypothetical protein HUG10_14800 [Halorarum halophilum]|uniref:Uncharacterized protein n=1 Tax=Halorarum halophilum TaxID=2743090 RepID=A0A7D5GGY6_9EURY|nr:hypothetical protein [Halobaculum halophilum]QLG28730.1 hypothetical protein HUG10_14800 [Halobaculum halophilum]
MRFSSSQESEDDPESRESAGVEARDGVRVLSDEGPSSNRHHRLVTDGGTDEEAEGDEEDEGADEGDEGGDEGEEDTEEEGEEEGEDEAAQEEGEEGEEEEEGEQGAEEEEGEEGTEEEGEEGEEGAEGEEEGEQGAEEGEEGEEGAEEEGERATVLHLDLEGLFLNLLGLEVDLNEVVLDVDAVKGENNLLGNLLSGVAGLLKPMSGGGLGSLLGGLPGLGDLLGGSGGEGEDEEGEGGGGVSNWASSAKESVSGPVSDALEKIDINAILTQVLKEFVSELFGDGSEESSESDGESST